MQSIGWFLTLPRRNLRSQLVKRMSFLPALFAGALFVAGGGWLLGQGVQIEKAPPAGQTSASPTPSAKAVPARTTPAEALFDYLQKYHLEVAKYQAGTRYIWTDRILIEITDAP